MLCFFVKEFSTFTVSRQKTTVDLHEEIRRFSLRGYFTSPYFCFAAYLGFSLAFPGTISYNVAVNLIYGRDNIENYRLYPNLGGH